VVNSELYEHDRIRAELKWKTGYKFKSRSDCEIVITLYEYYGMSFLSHLRGEFALCLFDERNQIFVAARDRYGTKPCSIRVLMSDFSLLQKQKLFYRSVRNPGGMYEA
jgi:asparagine synthase (glutamine-hydrolysing)